MSRILVVLAFVMLLLPSPAEAVPPNIVSVDDRMCNLDLRIGGASGGQGVNSGRANGICITSAKSNAGVWDDVACWHYPGNDTVYTTFIGGDADTGEYWDGWIDGPGYLGEDNASCNDFGGGMLMIALNEDNFAQAPSLVFDNGAMTNLGTDEPRACDCSCPLPATRDGVATAGNWTIETRYTNSRQNEWIVVAGSPRGDFVWSYRQTPSGGSPTGVFFTGALGDDTFVTYGQLVSGGVTYGADYYDDFYWYTGADEGGNDVIWAGAQEPGGTWYSSIHDALTGTGNDKFWLNSSTVPPLNHTWDLVSGADDQTTAYGATYVSHEDSTTTLPAMPSCPSWIENAVVTNGAYPGMQNQ